MRVRKNVTLVLHSSVVLTTACVLGYVSIVIFDIIYNEQKSDYVDEIFHIPQAKRYCQNQWMKWDPKITTLPGLYLVSYFFLKPLQLLGFENFCSVYSLRQTNVIGTTANFLIAYKITCSLEKKYIKFKSKFYFKLLTALNVAIFPPLYFFTFLYYTDVWSTTFVLWMYYLHLVDGRLYKILGGVSGFMAVLMRQTNIIWVGLMILDDVWNILGKSVVGTAVQEYKHSKITICLLFITFVTVNKSIVLGDKEAHSVTFHPMQVLYFLDFVAFFGWPFFVSEVASLWKKPVGIYISALFLVLCVALSETNKLEHPYLLADNRHLSFYLWKRIFGHGVLRRLAVPTYVCSGFLLMRVLQKRCLFLFTVLLSVCTMLNLTPQHLFELRYFIIPFIFYRLQFKQSKAVVIETVFYVGVNFGVIYLFLNRPFFWPNEPNVVQRFMW